MSSSGHLALLPRLAGWDYAELEPTARKAFEVALHAGSVPALLAAARRGGLGELRYLGLTLVPPAVLGAALEGFVERRLGRVEWVCAGQVIAGAAMLLADLSAERRRSAGAADHLVVGFAQAAALAPGVSRFGAALSVARLRGLSRSASLQLSLRAAVPVTVAAAGLKGARMAHGDLPAQLRPALAAGGVAALVSSLAALPLLSLLERPVAVRVLACYRIALGVAALAHERRAVRRVGPTFDPLGSNEGPHSPRGADRSA